MIVGISGKLIEKKDQSLVIDVNGIGYEVIVPQSALARIEETKDAHGNVHLITYHYLQISSSSGVAVLIGFISEVECDFFHEIIKVSGIGPRAAVKAFSQPISEIASAIERADVNYLKTLPGIGIQRAKEIVAKLQGKVAKFCLIQDRAIEVTISKPSVDWQEEALSILLQLQYKRAEALGMIEKAVKRSPQLKTSEELINEIYKQRTNI